MHRKKIHKSPFLRQRKKRQRIIFESEQRGSGLNPIPDITAIETLQTVNTINDLLGVSKQEITSPARVETEEVIDVDNSHIQPVQGLIQNNIRGKHEHPIYKLKQDLLKKYGF